MTQKEFRKSAVAAFEKDAVADDGYTFRGYASVFGGVDSYGDTIAKGAFAECLKTDTPKMFFNHNSSAVPIGKWNIVKEDDKGLFVEGELTKGIPEADQLALAMKAGTVDGMSIGFYADMDDLEINDKTNGFLINKIARLIEISVVTFPADSAARVSKAEAIDRVKDLESFLRDEGGFSAKEAKIIISKAKAINREAERDARSEKIAEISAMLKGIESKL